MRARFIHFFQRKIYEFEAAFTLTSSSSSSSQMTKICIASRSVFHAMNIQITNSRMPHRSEELGTLASDIIWLRLASTSRST